MGTQIASTLITSSGFLGQLGAWDGVGSAEAEIVACPVPNATRTIDRECDVNYWCEEQFWCKDQYTLGTMRTLPDGQELIGQ